MYMHLLTSCSFAHQLQHPPWYSGILTEEDFEIVNPHRAIFLRQLRELSARKQRILRDRALSEDQKNIQLEQLALPNPHETSSCIQLEELGSVLCRSVLIQEASSRIQLEELVSVFVGVC